MPEDFSIQLYLNDLEIIQQTAEQVKKDFSFFDITILFDHSKENAYAQLAEQIMPSIKHLIQSDNQKFISILYRVDISELQIKKESLQYAERPFEEIITGLVIKRCLQKVVLRKLFSKHD
jgi:hypothetical protein